MYNSVKVKSLSCVQLFATPWTVAYQAPLSMGFSRQEYWSGVVFVYSQGTADIIINSRSIFHILKGNPHTINCHSHSPSLTLGRHQSVFCLSGFADLGHFL